MTSRLDSGDPGPLVRPRLDPQTPTKKARSNRSGFRDLQAKPESDQL